MSLARKITRFVCPRTKCQRTTKCGLKPLRSRPRRIIQFAVPSAPALVTSLHVWRTHLMTVVTPSTWATTTYVCIRTTWSLPPGRRLHNVSEPADSSHERSWARSPSRDNHAYDDRRRGEPVRKGRRYYSCAHTSTPVQGKAARMPPVATVGMAVATRFLISFTASAFSAWELGTTRQVTALQNVVVHAWSKDFSEFRKTPKSGLLDRAGTPVTPLKR